jgi:hypothetical protein
LKLNDQTGQRNAARDGLNPHTTQGAHPPREGLGAASCPRLLNQPAQLVLDVLALGLKVLARRKAAD